MGKKEGGGGKAKKKKWSKGKSRDKLNNLVLFDKGTYDKLYKEVPTYKLITPSIVSERLKVRGSLARRALAELTEKGLIKQVVAHRSQFIYTRVTKDNEDEAPAEGGATLSACQRDVLPRCTLRRSSVEKDFQSLNARKLISRLRWTNPSLAILPSFN